MKKYLVVLSHCDQETYFFNSLKSMLKFFDVKSIQELLDLSSLWCEYAVFEISNFWEKN